jgi:hypothetical protein
MAAAVLQGVIVTTIDGDIWVDLPERHCIRLIERFLPGRKRWKGLK